MVINIGQKLETISGYKIKATPHRVIDIGSERYSCTFMMEPKLSARVSDKCLESSRASCEDLSYENDPQNKEEMEKIKPFGQCVVEKLRKKQMGFDCKDVDFDYEKRAGKKGQNQEEEKQN